MNEEIKYCKTINCPYRFTCKRFFYNNDFEDELFITYKEFEHTYTNCNYYIKMEV